MPPTKHFDNPEILGPERLGSQEQQEARVRKNFWRVLKRAGRSIPFVDEVVAAYYCALDPETPVRVRVMLMGALAYFVLPVDAVPDFLALVGFTDDVTVLAATIAMVRGHITAKHRDKAHEALKD
ncbi:hypothetical protein HDIA_3778 [Hartmannibacter diazotrophicus]|uniref:DUF1232 domain-containing protein n=1 Tax=Hartmannibacter diazotrophicus TaxID=1482074 RepID=A0A2C9DAW7_9HYPH|nr:YkvA family protein [Hartmannibacter diazotrophicus]SON57319.1 hypothetical protein HDIA_3778 [Hartmannibacter diazotrophicus]